MKRSELIRIRLELLSKETNEALLVAVSKQTDLLNIGYALDYGQKDFGENRVDDLYEKAIDLEKRHPQWHFIGNIQSNKIDKLFKVPNLKFIHSVSSYRILENICKKRNSFEGESLGLFLQVNTSDEEEKQGFDYKDYDEIARACNYFLGRNEPRLYLAGLMTMGKIRTTDFEKDARVCFRRLKRCRKNIMNDFDLNLKLSMGMSQDYVIATEEGSDFLRVGSKIFSPEKKR